MPETVLITGATGMVGTHLAARLAATRPGARVLCASARPGAGEPGEGAGPVPATLDIRQMEPLRRLLRRERPGVIHHLAAQSIPAAARLDPWGSFEVNVLGTVNLFEAIKAVRAEDAGYDPAVVVAGSSTAYGASLRGLALPVTEEAALQPLHPYGVTKATQDMLAFQYAENDGIRAIRARIFSTSGPGKVGDVMSDFAGRVARMMAEGTGEGRLRVGRLESRRAILDVNDLVEALILLGAHGRAGEAYNICADDAVAIGDLLPMFEAAAGLRLRPEADPALLRPSDEAILLGDTTRLRAATGWAPRIPLEATLRAVLAFEVERLSAPARPSRPHG